MGCCTIQGYAIDKNYYYITVVFIQIVLHWVLIEDVVLIEEIWYYLLYVFKEC